jgi:hypothetical protein
MWTALEALFVVVMEFLTYWFARIIKGEDD